MATVDVTEMAAKARAEALDGLKQDDLELPVRPSFRLPLVPTNITEKTDDYLMNLYTRFTRYQDYLQAKFVIAEIEENALERQLEIAKARQTARSYDSAAKSNGTSNARVQIAKAEAALTTEVRSLNGVFAVKRYHRKLLGTLFESAGRDANLVSRELSRRIGREAGERRTDRWNP